MSNGMMEIPLYIIEVCYFLFRDVKQYLGHECNSRMLPKRSVSAGQTFVNLQTTLSTFLF